MWDNYPFFFWETNTHTRERERGSIFGYTKNWLVSWSNDKEYHQEQVILHTIHSLKQCGTITHSFFEKQTHTQEREKGVQFPTTPKTD